MSTSRVVGAQNVVLKLFGRHDRSVAVRHGAESGHQQPTSRSRPDATTIGFGVTGSSPTTITRAPLATVRMNPDPRSAHSSKERIVALTRRLSSCWGARQAA